MKKIRIKVPNFDNTVVMCDQKMLEQSVSLSKETYHSITPPALSVSPSLFLFSDRFICHSM